MPNHDLPVSLSTTLKDHLQQQRSPRSVESTPLKDPEDFFKQYRMDFNRSQYAIDSVHRIKFKKTEEDDQMIQHHFDLSSFANIQFDKIAISPIQNSRNSNISESNRHPMSEMNVTKPLAASSNNVLGSDQLNEIGIVVGFGSNLNPRFRSNLANNELELDYSSFNPSSNNHNTLSQQHPLSQFTRDGQHNHNENHNNRDDDEQAQQIYRIQMPNEEYLRIGGGAHGNSGNNGGRDGSGGDNSRSKSLSQDDYDDLFDYNEPQSQQHIREKQIIHLSLTDRLRNTFKRLLFHDKKADTSTSANTMHTTITLLESQYRLINDLASDIYQATKRKADEIFQQCIQALCCCSKVIPAVSPSSKICLIWDIAAIAFFAVAFFMLSVQLCMNASVFFESKHPITGDNWMRAVAIILCVLDILKGMVIGFYSEGSYEKCTVTITHNYLKRGIYFDLLTFIPLVSQAESFDHYLARFLVSLLYLAKCNSILVAVRRVRVWIVQANLMARYFGSLLCSYSLLLHASTLLFHGIGLIEINHGSQEKSWLSRYDLMSANSADYVWDRYLQAASICAGFLSNIAAQFQAETLLEQGFSMLASFVSLILLAYFINEVSFSLKTQSESALELAEEKKHINIYMDQTNVPSELKGCVSNYLDYLHEKKEKQVVLQAAGAVIKKLPVDLRINLMCTMRSFYVPYFNSVLSKFSQLTLANTFTIIESQSYAPGDIIFRENELCDPSIYAIVSGEVEIYHTNNTSINSNNNNGGYANNNNNQSTPQNEQTTTRRDTSLMTLKHRDCFGEVGFFTNMPHTASARCTEFSTIVRISHSKFLALLSETNQEEDFEMMCMLRDEVLFKRNYKAINTACWSCHRYGHLAKQCKAIHFYPLKSKVISMHSSNYKQQRSPSFERLRKSRNRLTFSDKMLLQIKFAKDYVDQILEYLERYLPGQSNRSDYQQSSQSLTNTVQQSSNTEILSDKIDYEQLQNVGSNLDLPQPFNTTFKPILNSNTLNESSMIRQAGASSSKVKHKDSTDSLDMMKQQQQQRKDSAQTKNSNDSSFVKHKSTNRSQNNNSNKRDSPIDLILKVDTMAGQIEPTSNLRKASNESSQPSESLKRDKTLKSQKTRGTQKTNKTNKTNKSGSSLYRSMFEHAPVQHADSKMSIPASPHRSPLLQQENGTKILMGSGASKNSRKSSGQGLVGSGGQGLVGSAGMLLGNSFEYVESEQNLSYELVLPRIELVMTNSAQKPTGAATAAAVSGQHQQQIQMEKMLLDNQFDNHSNMSSMFLDQQSIYSRTESNVLGGAVGIGGVGGVGPTSPYQGSYFRPSNVQNNALEFDCMKNFKVYNTKSNLKNVLSNSRNTDSKGMAGQPAGNDIAKRAPKKKVTIIENVDL